MMKNTRYPVVDKIYVSASCGEGSYSDSTSHEIAIIDDGPRGNNTFGIRYDLTANDVYGWFPTALLKYFVEWLKEDRNRNYLTNVDNEVYNLPYIFLREIGEDSSGISPEDIAHIPDHCKEGD